MQRQASKFSPSSDHCEAIISETATFTFELEYCYSDDALQRGAAHRIECEHCQLIECAIIEHTE